MTNSRKKALSGIVIGTLLVMGQGIQAEAATQPQAVKKQPLVAVMKPVAPVFKTLTQAQVFDLLKKAQLAKQNLGNPVSLTQIQKALSPYYAAEWINKVVIPSNYYKNNKGLYEHQNHISFVAWGYDLNANTKVVYSADKKTITVYEPYVDLSVQFATFTTIQYTTNGWKIVKVEDEKPLPITKEIAIQKVRQVPDVEKAIQGDKKYSVYSEEGDSLGGKGYFTFYLAYNGTESFNIIEWYRVSVATGLVEKMDFDGNWVDIFK